MVVDKSLFHSLTSGRPGSDNAHFPTAISYGARQNACYFRYQAARSHPGFDNLATFAGELFGRKGQACFGISFFSSFPGFAEFFTN
jgi:hypothetical protein